MKGIPCISGISPLSIIEKNQNITYQLLYIPTYEVTWHSFRFVYKDCRETKGVMIHEFIPV